MAQGGIGKRTDQADVEQVLMEFRLSERPLVWAGLARLAVLADAGARASLAGQPACRVAGANCSGGRALMRLSRRLNSVWVMGRRT